LPLPAFRLPLYSGPFRRGVQTCDCRDDCRDDVGAAIVPRPSFRYPPSWSSAALLSRVQYGPLESRTAGTHFSPVLTLIITSSPRPTKHVVISPAISVASSSISFSLRARPVSSYAIQISDEHIFEPLRLFIIPCFTFHSLLA
jgi:hypothetical protein